jgi:hypothetical protein
MTPDSHLAHLTAVFTTPGRNCNFQNFRGRTPTATSHHRDDDSQASIGAFLTNASEGSASEISVYFVIGLLYQMHKTPFHTASYVRPIKKVAEV